MKHEVFPAIPTTTPDRCRRANISLLCEVRQGSNPWTLIRLEDISERGFRIAWLPQCNPDRLLSIRLPGLQKLEAKICWQEGLSVGCEFTSPLHIYVFEHFARLAAIDQPLPG